MLMHDRWFNLGSGTVVCLLDGKHDDGRGNSVFSFVPKKGDFRILFQDLKEIDLGSTKLLF